MLFSVFLGEDYEHIFAPKLDKRRTGWLALLYIFCM